MGPFRLIELFAEVADDGNAFTLCEEYGVRLMDIRLLRKEPMYIVSYLTNRLRCRAKKPAVILQFQKRA